MIEPSPNEPNQPDDVTVDDAVSPATIGAALADARVEQSVPLADVAANLRLTKTAVLRLEAGNWDSLGAAIYARGYVRNYGRLLGLDMSSQLAQLPAATVTDSEPALTPAPSSPTAVFEPALRLATYVAGTSLIAIPLYFLLTQTPDWLQPGSNQTDDSRAVVTRPAPVRASLTPSTRGFETPDGVIAPAEPVVESPPSDEQQPTDDVLFADESDVEPTTVVPTATDSRTTQPLGDSGLEQVLTLSMAEETWLQIETSTGERIAYGLVPAGSKREFRLTETASVIVGNADGVNAILNGQTLDLRQYQRGQLARFSIEPGS